MKSLTKSNWLNNKKNFNKYNFYKNKKSSFNKSNGTRKYLTINTSNIFNKNYNKLKIV